MSQQAVCEVCKSTSLVEDAMGFFICGDCGTQSQVCSTSRGYNLLVQPSFLQEALADVNEINATTLTRFRGCLSSKAWFSEQFARSFECVFCLVGRASGDKPATPELTAGQVHAALLAEGVDVELAAVKKAASKATKRMLAAPPAAPVPVPAPPNAAAPSKQESKRATAAAEA